MLGVLWPLCIVVLDFGPMNLKRLMKLKRILVGSNERDTGNVFGKSRMRGL